MADTETVDRQPPVDLAFLDQYTGGDDGLRDQVLSMFIEQVDLLLGRLKDVAGSATDWQQVTHSLKGCARGVGANALAEIARDAEAAASAAQSDHDVFVRDLRAEADQAITFIRSVIKTD